MRYIRLIFILMLLGFVAVAMAQNDTTKQDEIETEDRSKGQRLKIFNARGVKIGKVFNRTREPKIMVDTVRMDTGYAELFLSSSFAGGRHNVAPSSVNHIFPFATQILDSLDAPKFTYAIFPTSGGRKLQIQSSSNEDSSKVVIMAIIN